MKSPPLLYGTAQVPQESVLRLACLDTDLSLIGTYGVLMKFPQRGGKDIGKTGLASSPSRAVSWADWFARRSGTWVVSSSLSPVHLLQVSSARRSSKAGPLGREGDARALIGVIADADNARETLFQWRRLG